MSKSWESATDYNEYITYEGDCLIGKKCPSLDSLQYAQGEKVTLDSDKNTVLVFWAKFLKDNCFESMTGVENMCKSHSDDLQAVCVSIDPAMKDVKRFIEKKALACDLPLAFDEDSKFKKSLMELADLETLKVPQAIIVDKNGVIVWRCKFSKAYKYSESRFEEQLVNVIKGTELYTNGPSPDGGDDEPEEETECFAPPPKAADDCW